MWVALENRICDCHVVHPDNINTVYDIANRYFSAILVFVNVDISYNMHLYNYSLAFCGHLNSTEPEDKRSIHEFVIVYGVVVNFPFLRI